MKNLFIGFTIIILLSSTAFSACSEVVEVLSKSTVFKNLDNDGNELRRIKLESTPVGIWISQDDGIGSIRAKNHSNMVGMVRIKQIGGKCVFVVMVYSEQQSFGHEVVKESENSIRFIVEEGDEEVFFSSSTLVAITDKDEAAK